MKAQASFKMGEATYSLEVEEKDPKDTLLQIITLANPPRFCQVCRKDALKSLYANKDKDGNIYIKVRCACGAEATLGSYKSGGYFWHEFKTYDKNAI